MMLSAGGGVHDHAKLIDFTCAKADPANRSDAIRMIRMCFIGFDVYCMNVRTLVAAEAVVPLGKLPIVLYPIVLLVALAEINNVNGTG